MIENDSIAEEPRYTIECPYCFETIKKQAKICSHCSTHLTSLGRVIAAISPIIAGSSLIAVVLAFVSVCQTAQNLRQVTAELSVSRLRSLMPPSPAIPQLKWSSLVEYEKGEEWGGSVNPYIRLPIIIRGEVPVDSVVPTLALFSIWGDTLKSVYSTKSIPKKESITFRLERFWSPMGPAWPSDTVYLDYSVKVQDYLDSLMYMTRGVGVASFYYNVYWRTSIEELSAVFMLSFIANERLNIRNDSLRFFTPSTPELWQRAYNPKLKQGQGQRSSEN